MNVKNRLIHLVARNTCSALRKDYVRSGACQSRVFRKLITGGRRSQFGRDHQFSAIQNISDFQSRVPVRDYEDFQAYIQQVQAGQPDILWPGKPKYLAKTSGTTSGMKYIPLTRDSIKNHMHAARNSLFHYIDAKPDTKIFDGSMFFLSGSPELRHENGIAVGRLSGIVNHEIPNWFKRNKLPDFQLNTIQPWEDKIEALVEAYSRSDIRVLSGIPPWIQMFCERILDFTGKSCLMDVYPNLELYIHGGVNFSPYRQKISHLIGGELTLLETYPASEGFIAFQDQYQEDAMQLVVNDGIFYEFIEKEQASDPNATRLRLEQVELHKDYAIILSTNAGLWAYRIGDLVRFVSLNPHKIKVSGRISQYISAFGEHVISSEIDHAMSMAQKQHRFDVVEFTVAPQVSPTDNRTAYHEWFIEFSELPKNISEIAQTINQYLCECNAYYRDLIDGKILDTLKIRPIRKNGFLDYMRKAGKLGEQYKVHRLSNDRILAEQLRGDVEEG